MPKPAIKKYLTLISLLVLFFALDRAIAPRDFRHSELAGLRRQATSLRRNPKADTLVLGSSTIGGWLTPRELARILNVAPSTILDGHLSACYPSCSYSVVEQLKSNGRKFRKAFVGVNLFAMCQGGAALRVMQNIELTPNAKLPEVFATYMHAPHAGAYIGTGLAMLVSHAYRDTTYQQNRLAVWAFGNRHRPDLWRREDAKFVASNDGDEPGEPCYTQPSKLALQTQFLTKELESLSEITDQIYLLSLPQRSLGDPNPSAEVTRAWRDHHKRLVRLTRRFPKVKLLDMTTGEIAQHRYFRDGLHLNRAGMRLQSKRLRQMMKPSATATPRARERTGKKPPDQRTLRGKAKRQAGSSRKGSEVQKEARHGEIPLNTNSKRRTVRSDGK